MKGAGKRHRGGPKVRRRKPAPPPSTPEEAKAREDHRRTLAQVRALYAIARARGAP